MHLLLTQSIDPSLALPKYLSLDLSQIENTILDVNETSSENIRTNEKIKEFVYNLKNYGKEIFEYRKELNKIFKNSLGNYQLEHEKEKRALFNCCWRKLIWNLNSSLCNKYYLW